jgi:hypothetical protein
MREKCRDGHGIFALDNTRTLCTRKLHQGMRLIQPDQTSAVRTSASATAQVSIEMRRPGFDFCMALCARVRASSETISCPAIGAIFAFFLPQNLP